MSTIRPTTEEAQSTEGTKRSKAGRRSRLTPQVQDRIIISIKAGNYLADAAEWAGVSVNAVNEWIRRGEGRDPKRKSTPQFAAFAAAVKQAEAFGKVNLLAQIKSAAQPGQIERETITHTFKDGSAETRVIERPAKHYWQAAAWILERRFPEQFGRRDRLEHASPGSDKVQHEHRAQVEELIARIYGNREDKPDNGAKDSSGTGP